MDNVTYKIISILLIILWFICFFTYFNTQYKSKQEQKRLKQKPILKATLVCSNKIVDLDDINIYVSDFVIEKGYIYFKFKEECFLCSVPIELFENIETGKEFEAEFYIDEIDDYKIYYIKSINSVEIPLRDCKKYIEY